MKRPFIFIAALYIFLTSCTNRNQENRIKELELQVAKLDSSISLKHKVNSQKHITTDGQSELSSLSVAEKFVGSWKYYGSLPPDKDNSMSGIVCELERYANTNETFVFHLWDGHDLILSIQDDNTLIGQNAALSVKYDPKTDRISLVFSSGNESFYSRLK